jgi:hypothetical protein
MKRLSFELISKKKMRPKPHFAFILLTACVSIFLSLPAFARPANSRQDPETAHTQSGSQKKKRKPATSPGKDVGKGGEDIGKGAAKGAESLGKGTAGAAGNLVTLHPGNAAADLGKGVAGAGKDVGVGAGKGVGKIGEGSAKGIGKLGGKIVHKSGKNTDKEKTNG